jgi:hypothetical protein
MWSARRISLKSAFWKLPECGKNTDVRAESPVFWKNGLSFPDDEFRQFPG